MFERKKIFGSSLHNVSKKRLEEIKSGLFRKKTTKLKPMSAKMRQRVKDWRQTAQDVCTVDGVMYCALCGRAITGDWVAHHYMQRRGQAHTIDNDKYVAALHPRCHESIDHNNPEAYNLAKDKIEKMLKIWSKK